MLVIAVAPVNVNPARAGMIPRLFSTPIFMSGKPRASGDDPLVWGFTKIGAW